MRPLALMMVVLVTAGALDGVPAAAPPTPPPPARRVTDLAGFLSPSTVDRLDRELMSFERQSGHQLIVYVFRSSAPEPIEDFAARVFKAWGVGKKGLDDGAALFIAAADRKARIEVGYGLEGELTDLDAGRILDETLIPRLRAGDPDGAVTAAVAALITHLGGTPEVAPPPSRIGERAPSPIASLGGLIMFLVLLVLLIKHPWLALMFMTNMRGRGGGGFSGGGGFGSGGGGFSGGGGSSGGGGATRGW